MKAVRPVFLVAFAGILAIHAFLWGLPGDGQPTVFRPTPGRKGVAVEIPRGEVFLIEVLQRFADFTGETAYQGGDNVSPTTTIRLSQTVNALDEKTAASVLKEAGYELSRETYRGTQVYWIQRLIVKPRQTGGLFRRGSEGAESAPATAGGPAGRSDLSLFERRDGNGARYLVIFETGARSQAEEALELLKAYRPRDRR